MQPQQNPYDFITNHPAKTTEHKTKRLMFIAGAGVVLVVLLWLIAIFAGGNNTPNTSVVAAKQENIIKVTQFGIEKAKTSEAKNLAATVLSVVSSQNQELKNTNSSKESDELKLKTSDDYKSIEEKLTQAEQSNNFDSELISQISLLLKDYQAVLEQIEGLETATNFNSQISVILNN